MSKEKQQVLLPGTTQYMFQGDALETRHTIIQNVGIPDIYSLDAYTYDDEWFRGLLLRCDEKNRDGLIRLLERKERWLSLRPLTLIGVAGTSTSVSVPMLSIPGPIGRVTKASEDVLGDWVLSPEEILQRLENSSTSDEDRTTAILFAETMAFSKDQRTRLLAPLLAFITTNRFSKCDDMIAAVGSAIRKFAMNMPESSFGDYSNLLAITDTETLPCEIELELAKAASWRLNKGIGCATFESGNLGLRLAELASVYLAPRLLLQKNHASIVIHSVIAVALLNGPQQDELIDRISGLRMNWFTELFARRLVDAMRKQESATVGRPDNLKKLHERLIAARN